MTFPYAKTVGTPSWQSIIAFSKRSGISLTDTQDNPPGSGGFHGTGNAVDFSNGGDAGTPEMDAFAKFWLGYSQYLLELIHVNQDGSGTYVKYGVVVPAAFYAAVLGQHHNHVHVAATNEGLQAASNGSPIDVPSATGTITNASLVSSIPGVSGLDTLYKFVTDPHNWFRLAMFIGGGVLLFLALRALGENFG